MKLVTCPWIIYRRWGEGGLMDPWDSCGLTSSDQWSLDITHDHLENMTAELSKFVFDNFGEFRSLIFLRIFEFDIYRNV